MGRKDNFLLILISKPPPTVMAKAFLRKVLPKVDVTHSVALVAFHRGPITT